MMSKVGPEKGGKAAAEPFKPIDLRNGKPEPIENLVLEGGGVKGYAYAGLVQELNENGTLEGLKRVAGSSAGGIAALMIGLGMTAKEIEDEMNTLDFKKFQDGPEQYWAEFFHLSSDPLKKLEDVHRMMTSDKKGMYKGDYFTAWAQKLIQNKLGKANATFRDLHSYMAGGDNKLKDMVFTGTVVAGTREPGSICYFRYDENNPESEFNDMPIAEAVRITMSFPGAFEMVAHKNKDGSITYFADGGIKSNFPMEIFDDRRYLPIGAPVTDNLKNPRTLGFKIDSISEIATATGLKEKVIKFAKDNNVIPKTGEVSRKQYEQALAYAKKFPVEKSMISEAQYKFLFEDVYDIKSMLGVAKQIFSSIRNDTDKIGKYEGRAYQIDDNGVDTLNFNLSDQEKQGLLDNGKTEGSKFFKKFTKESRDLLYNEEKYLSNLENLDNKMDKALKVNDTAKVAVYYFVLENEVQRLLSEKNNLNEKLPPIIEKDLILYSKSIDKMIKSAEAKRSVFNSKIRANKVVNDMFDSAVAKGAVKDYQKNLTAYDSRIAEERSKKEEAIVEKVEKNIKVLEGELVKFKSEREVLDSQIIKFQKEREDFIYESLVNRDNKQFSELQKTFYEKFSDIREKQKELVEIDKALTEIRPGALSGPKLQALEEKKRELNLKISGIITSVGTRIDQEKALSNDQKNIMISCFLKVENTEDFQNSSTLVRSNSSIKSVNSINPEPSLKSNKGESLFDSVLKANSKKLGNQKEEIGARIKETEENLEKSKKMLTNYKEGNSRSKFFGDLVDLNDFLLTEIKKNRFTVKDWIRYSCEQCWGIGSVVRWAFGDDATQKSMRETNARALRGVVETTYKGYVDKQTDASQFDMSVFNALKNNLLYTEKNLHTNLIQVFTESIKDRKVDFGLTTYAMESKIFKAQMEYEGSRTKPQTPGKVPEKAVETIKDKTPTPVGEAPPRDTPKEKASPLGSKKVLKLSGEAESASDYDKLRKGDPNVTPSNKNSPKPT